MKIGFIFLAKGLGGWGKDLVNLFEVCILDVQTRQNVLDLEVKSNTTKRLNVWGLFNDDVRRDRI